jgi:hypothetical protein
MTISHRLGRSGYFEFNRAAEAVPSQFHPDVLGFVQEPESHHAVPSWSWLAATNRGRAATIGAITPGDVVLSSDRRTPDGPRHAIKRAGRGTRRKGSKLAAKFIGMTHDEYWHSYFSIFHGRHS